MLDYNTLPYVPVLFFRLPISLQSALAEQGEFKTKGLISISNPVSTPPAVFKGEGSGITNVSVATYSLSRRLVFSSGWEAGNSVEWQIRNDHGQLLANGVYLYILEVKNLGTVLISEVAEMVILS